MAAHAGGLTVEEDRPTAVGAAVRVRSLVRSYGAKRILDDLDLTVDDGEFVAILGRSGSGKSTLLRALAALDHGVDGSGEVVVPDQVSVVFQDSRLLPWARVLNNVVLGLDGGSRGRSRAAARDAGRASLAEVGLAGRERHRPDALSGGQQQRVAIARALVTAPAVVFADEPTGALDTGSGAEILNLLRRLVDTGQTVVLVTHDPAAAAVADRVLTLTDGRIVGDRAC